MRQYNNETCLVIALAVIFFLFGTAPGAFVIYAIRLLIG